MAYLLDTHTLLWWLADDPALPGPVREIIRDPNQAMLVSAASSWEISIKRALGKLRAPDELLAILEEEGFQELPISWAHAQQAGRLPPIHRDPFDRMLIAQALLQGMTLLTADADIARYEVRTFWAQ